MNNFKFMVTSVGWFEEEYLIILKRKTTDTWPTYNMYFCFSLLEQKEIGFIREENLKLM
jgi:hypothetical protein